jgi:hypothetical protein
MKEEKPQGVSLLGNTSGPSAHSGRRPNPKAVVSAMPTKAIPRITGVMAVPLLLVMLLLPEQGKEIRDRHHVLEFFGLASSNLNDLSATRSFAVSSF